MPVIGAAVHVPGTRIGLGVQLAHQSRAEKEHDAAMSVLESATHEHREEDSSDPVRGGLGKLLSSASPLDRFGGPPHSADGASS